MSKKNNLLLAIMTLALPAAWATGIGAAGAAPLPMIPGSELASDVTPLANVETTFEVKGMYCATCPVTVKTAAKKVPGVIDARVSREQERAWVTYDPSKTTPEAIATAITKAGYPAKPLP